MNRKDLTDYVGMIADMENNNYLMQNTIALLKQQSESLCHPITIAAPAAPLQPSIDPNGKLKTALCSLGGLPLTLGGGIFFVLTLIAAFTNLQYGIILVIALLGIFGTASFFCIHLGIKMLGAANNIAKKSSDSITNYEQQMIQYRASMVIYENDKDKERRRLEKESKEKSLIDAEIVSAENRLQQGRKILDEMYSIGIIHPKYREMTAINTIYEYLDTGICSTLTGATGAYNKLEEEKARNTIILGLTTIISRLDSISRNQYQIYTAIKEGNEVTDKIVHSVKELSMKCDDMENRTKDYTDEIRKLQKTSMLTAYNTERINKELHYMNRMKYIAGEYNKAFNNHLP